MTRKHDLFDELMEGFDALADRRGGKRTLRTHVMKTKPAPRITARELAKVRQDMNLSRGLFARYLRTNVRTLENWEQGRAKPNAQASVAATKEASGKDICRDPRDQKFRFRVSSDRRRSAPATRPFSVRVAPAREAWSLSKRAACVRKHEVVKRTLAASCCFAITVVTIE